MLIQGKARYAKVLGAPVWGYENAHKEWTIDVEVDEKTQERIKKEGLGDKIKTKDGATFVTFKRKEFKADGTPNKPIRIVGPDGKSEWDQKTKIGNGSTVNVNFAINEYKPGKFTWNILSMQVWELVGYDGGEFEANPTAPKSEAEDWSE